MANLIDTFFNFLPVICVLYFHHLCYKETFKDSIRETEQTLRNTELQKSLEPKENNSLAVNSDVDQSLVMINSDEGSDNEEKTDCVDRTPQMSPGAINYLLSPTQ